MVVGMLSYIISSAFYSFKLISANYAAGIRIALSTRELGVAASLRKAG
jgi:hypothetical protein